MNQLIKVIPVGLFCIFSLGCVNNAPQLGGHVAKLKTEQVYNPNASIDNLGFVPSGSGERMEGAYQTYTGKKDSDLKGTDSQVLDSFAE
ncbi:hypothetical protein EJ063_12260 [Vibrio aquaticus]|uniref:Uncharacterized protein n=1 Tax=Vibrio aquaticus TaxID=2496559 RepID=A0A3S0P5K4_9VIBR|nr:hypothetical protein [Vibrio aquaticus]RTZ15229.1 hypothetical protein EJ063_12260 [Vibrio aquaticus]